MIMSESRYRKAQRLIWYSFCYYAVNENVM